MIKWILKMIDRIFAVVGAIVFAQFPQFYSQYLHELSGHVGELIYQASLMEQSAKISGKSVKELIAKFIQNSDPDFIRQGDLMQGVLDRLNSFTVSQAALEHASILAKPFLFIRYADPSIAKETLTGFNLGFSLTFEGVAYALIGMVIGYSIFSLIGGALRWIVPTHKQKA